jgi:glycosyltransferase involved in cell wall biosynthesis
MERVSLYIPCYNVEQHIRACIEGVLRQTYPVNEILIIDDGCRDRTVEIASQYPVRIIRHNVNRGLSAGRNTAFREAKNELVAALDADCIPDPTWLEEVMQALTETDAAASGGRLVESVLESLADRWRKAHMTQDWGEARVINPSFMFGNNGVLRKSIVVEAGWYDEKLRTNAEDYDLSQRIRGKGYNLVYEPRAVVRHQRRDSVSSILNTFWRYSCFAYFQPVTWKNVLRSIRYQLCTTCVRFVRADFRTGNYDLLWLDTILPFYLAYKDLRLIL